MPLFWVSEADPESVSERLRRGTNRLVETDVLPDGDAEADAP